MKKLIGFMSIMFALTMQNALAQYTECIPFTEWSDNIKRCEKHCKESGHGMKQAVYIHHSNKAGMPHEVREKYESCVEKEKKALCACTQ